VASIHVWSALAWGARSRDYGVLDGVRKSVAKRLYRYADLAILLGRVAALEPDPEQIVEQLHACETRAGQFEQPTLRAP